MFVVGNLVHAIAIILDKTLWVYNLVILVSVLMSWVSPDPFNPIVQFLRAITEPVFGWIRRRMPFTMVGMIDLSPLVAILLIQLLNMVVVRSLYELSFRLR